MSGDELEAASLNVRFDHQLEWRQHSSIEGSRAAQRQSIPPTVVTYAAKNSVYCIAPRFWDMSEYQHWFHGDVPRIVELGGLSVAG